MQETLLNILRKLQVFFATQKPHFLRFFIFIQIGIFTTLITFSILTWNNFSRFGSTMRELGELAAQASFVTYLLTLIPGILRRLQIYPLYTNPIATIFMLFRRQLGITLFFLAFTHNIFSRMLPLIIFYGFGPELTQASTFEMMGTLSLIILFPLWLTSNDTSVKILGRNWKKLHAFTYLALFFIFLHVLLQKSNWALPGALFLGLEVLSWIIAWSRKKAPQAPPPQMVQ